MITLNTNPTTRLTMGNVLSTISTIRSITGEDTIIKFRITPQQLENAKNEFNLRAFPIVGGADPDTTRRYPTYKSVLRSLKDHLFEVVSPQFLQEQMELDLDDKVTVAGVAIDGDGSV